jgi:hypothetical protein
MTISGQCHCGAVKITLPSPAYRLQCNCSLCCQTGWTGIYADPAEVVVEGGEGCQSYIQGDKMIALWRCAHCGIATHWTPITAPPDRMGINARLFDPDWWEALEVHYSDGRSL